MRRDGYAVRLEGYGRSKGKVHQKLHVHNHIPTHQRGRTDLALAGRHINGALLVHSWSAMKPAGLKHAKLRQEPSYELPWRFILAASSCITIKNNMEQYHSIQWSTGILYNTSTVLRRHEY